MIIKKSMEGAKWKKRHFKLNVLIIILYYYTKCIL